MPDLGARVMFEDLVGYANHVGLFSEEISKSGEALGEAGVFLATLAMLRGILSVQEIHRRHSRMSAAFPPPSIWTGY